MEAAKPITWDAHINFQLGKNASLEGIEEYRRIGYNYVSVNVGMDLTSLSDTLSSIAGFTNYIYSHPSDYLLATSVDAIHKAMAGNMLAIGFDLEGSNAFLSNPNMVGILRKLGVNQALLAYNIDNEVSGGCLGEGRGLSELGKQIVKEMNKVGMLVDLSHMSERATFDAMNISEKPCIFSHSNPKALKEHPRNISDEQIMTCAKQGGVIGINGLGSFLGDNDCSSTKIVQHILYVSNLVGPEHVGLGLDTECNMSSQSFFQENPQVNPLNDGEECSIASINQIVEIRKLLKKEGLSDEDVNNIMGKNFYRVAKKVWSL
ncbi:MAG: membrane dipeptidase [Bdellovibrionales bacterium]|nr:membrane dipeptidase [Bdellovibrionales bacterium]